MPFTLDTLKSLEGEAFTNLGAYQLQPGIGWKYGYKTIKEAVVNGDVFQDLRATYCAVLSATSIKEAVEDGSKAFGGYVSFLLFQAVLDYYWITGDERVSTEVYEGAGSKPAVKALGVDLQTLTNEMQKLGLKREVYLSDAEHALCEYRKYVYQKARLAVGKKISKTYKPNSMGK